MLIWTYRRCFTIDGHRGEVVIRSHTNRMESTLTLDGEVRATDQTPAFGPGSTRNHALSATLPDGRALAVEAGYISHVSVGIAVRLDGVLIHESHPGRTIAYPENMRVQAEAMRGTTMKEAMLAEAGTDSAQMKRTLPSLAVDIALGLLFFVVAKMTDLTTAALVGAGAGLALVVVQRFVRVDLLGGLALFGIVMMLLSAGYALVFQDETAVQMRPTILGLIAAVLFLGDSLFGGRYLGARMRRYIFAPDIDVQRLARAVGTVGLIGAGLNYAVVQVASKDVWLFYTTFGDIVLVMGLMYGAIRYATVPPSRP
ncbi:MAG: hypothetical protein RLY86_3890 [Pseudomonadota bacterium]|jgi:intracellular septation protein A